MKALYKQIIDYVMNNINNNQWPVGYMLPTEIELQKQFNVSRSTVRTALLQLVNEGYLVRKKGKGTFVTKPKTLENSTIFIESFAEEMRSKGLTAKTEVLEFRSLKPDKRIADHLDLTEESDVIKLTRLRYCKDSFNEGPIVLTTSYFPDHLEFIKKYDLEKISMHDVLEENGIHRHIIEKEITVFSLGVKESRLLGVSEGMMSILVTSIVWDQDNRIIEYSESYYPTDRNKFVLKIRS